MENMIENPTKEQIEDYLKEIGWSLIHHGNEHYYFYNYKYKNTGLSLVFPKTDGRDGRIELQAKNYDQTPAIYFYLKDIIMEMVDDNCVGFVGKNDKGIFLQLRNYRMKK